MTVYTEVKIEHSPPGFGQFQLGELQISPENSWAMLGDLLAEMAEEPIEIEEAIRRFGCDDPRGSIIGGDPDFIYALNLGSEWIGIIESEVEKDFFRLNHEAATRRTE